MDWVGVDMTKRKIARIVSGGLRDIEYKEDDEPIRDNEHSLAFKDELHKWQANPRKYWWEHGGKKKVIIGSIIVLIAIILSLIFLL